MTEQFSLGDDDISIGKVPNEKRKDDELLAESAAEISKGIALTDDEKKEIETKKKSKKSPKNVEVNEAWLTTDELTDEELDLSKALQADLSSFINSKTGLEEGTAKVDTLPTGIQLLDAVLGGGFGVGTFSMIAGNPGTFKSSLLGQIIGNSQKKFKGKLLTSYLDSESAMTMKRLWQLGARQPAVKPYSDITVEDVFKTIEAICSFKILKSIEEVPAIVAWDSVANTTTSVEKKTPDLDINKVIGLRARILSFVLPRYISKMKEHNCSLIAVNQLRDKLDMGQYAAAADLKWMGDKTMPGGNSLKFNAFHLLLLKTKEDLKEEQWGFSGITIEAKCIKNKIFRPNIPVKLIVDFNHGISNFWTNYKYLTELKLIQAGGWSYLKALPDVKWQGTYKAQALYDENTNGFRDAFDAAVIEAIQINIIDKYGTDDSDIPDEEDV